MAKKLKGHSKRVGGWFYRKLPWYGKILVPIVGIVLALYVIEWIASFFI
ncbi:MAG: hypothetical protein ACTH4Y_03765 [Microbacterium gubbeenense]